MFLLRQDLNDIFPKHDLFDFWHVMLPLAKFSQAFKSISGFPNLFHSSSSLAGQIILIILALKYALTLILNIHFSLRLVLQIFLDELLLSFWSSFLQPQEGKSYSQGKVSLKTSVKF